MDVTPIDPTSGAARNGSASTASSPPAGAFDATLQQAMTATATPPAPPAPTAKITLGQMLAVYARPRSAALGAAPALEAAAGTAGAARAAAAAPGAGAVPAGATETAASGELGVGPVARPLPGEVGSAWGSRRHPIHGDVRMHHGVDISAPTGTPIRAFADGTVTYAGPRGGYGNVVIVEHANGIETRYAHQSSMDVRVGDHVAAGAVVGRVGATGTATGPHLHFELRRRGESIDPGAYLP